MPRQHASLLQLQKASAFPEKDGAIADRAREAAEQADGRRFQVVVGVGEGAERAVQEWEEGGRPSPRVPGDTVASQVEADAQEDV